jgi:glycosyltransferase involved in cell wall biosynthesis
MRVSVVIPAYNEARRLPATLVCWREFLSAQPYASELVVVDDGSTDATASIAQGALTRVVRLVPNRGKGGAVKAGVLDATGDVIVYVDADLNIGPQHLLQALRLLDQGADLVAGRRDLAEYAAAEGPVRLLAGGIVQLTRRVLVMSAIQDTQCGFKVFRRELARAVFARTRISSFAFDIEVLFLARRLGARIVEMPVTTTYRGESTFNVRRHLPLFLSDIVRIRLNVVSRKYDLPRVRPHP